MLNRYKETRRRHPLAPTGSVTEGIARERELLAPLREQADLVIDTSGLTAAPGCATSSPTRYCPPAVAAAGWR